MKQQRYKKIPSTFHLPPSAGGTSHGFTLIEAVIAILILSLSIGALLTLAASGFFSVRYARNQIVADNLLQESLEYVRNSRDSASQIGTLWEDWTATLNVNANGQPVGGGATRGCFDADKGCWIDPYVSTDQVRECTSACPFVTLFPDQGFYGYEENEADYPFGALPSTDPVTTTYVRKVVVEEITTDELEVTAMISWKNGQATKTVSQSILLTNWNQ